MVGFRSYSLKVTPLRSVVIVEVALSKDVPLSVDLTIFPLAPTATNVSFPNVTPKRVVVIGEIASFQVAPLSVDLTISPFCPTPTKVLFPKVTP